MLIDNRSNIGSFDSREAVCVGVVYIQCTENGYIAIIIIAVIIITVIIIITLHFTNLIHRQSVWNHTTTIC